MEQDNNFFVFISYSSLDEKWAIWLRHELDHYHLPASFNGRSDVRDNLREVFRDRDELSAGIEWDEQVNEALERTENLIVICSPNAAKSHAVNKEVRKFVALGKKDHIFPFIVEGNSPKDYFPKALKRAKVGGDVNKDGGRDIAFIKIVAGLLNVSFSSLWNRYEIEKAEEERRIREQRDNLLRVQSRFMAEKVSDLVDDNNSLLGSLLALEALPNKKNPERPYVIEAEFALRKACSNRSAVILGHEDGCLFASFSPDGKYIVSGSADKTARIWNAEDCCLLAILPHNVFVDSAYYNITGDYIVTSEKWEKTFNIWDAHNGKLIRTVEGHEDGIGSAVFSPDGKWIITASSDNTIRKWDIKNFREVLRITGDYKGFRYASTSPDGKCIISSSYDNAVRIWDSSTGKLIKVLCITSYDTPFVEYSPDGKLIAMAKGSHVIIWDANKYNVLLDIPVFEKSINMLAFSPDSQKLATIAEDKIIYLWEVQVKYELENVHDLLIKTISGHTMEIYSCRFSPNGRLLLTASWDQSVRLWDVDDHIVYSENTYSRLFDISYAEYSPDGKLMAIVYNNNVIRIRDTEKFRIKGVLVGHTDYPNRVHFDSEGKRVVTTSCDMTVRVWDVERSVCLNVINLEDKASEACFSPSGSILAIVNSEHIFLYDTINWTLLNDIKVKGSREFRYISFSPDGDMLVTIQGSNILIYEMSTGNLIKSVAFQPNSLENVRYDTTGKYIYFLSSHSLYRIDTKTMSEIEEFKGHTDAIKEYAFSYDQAYIATASYDKSLRIWDAATRNTLHICTGCTRGVSSVNFQPDGRTILATSFDGTIRKWDFPNLYQLIDETNKRFENRQLSQEERKKYYLD